jgi:hypothetical protein
MPRLALPENTLLSITGPRAVSFSYMNWKGEMRRRKAVMVAVFWGSNEWHSEPQWLIKGKDLEKDALRTYALKDMRDVRPIKEEEKHARPEQ